VAKLPKEKAMPNGVYPVPSRNRKGGSGAPMIGLRAKVWLGRRRLDQRLAHGENPRSSRELQLRAHQICTEAARERLARSLKRAVRDAREPRPVFRPQVPVRAAAILKCVDDIEALIARLRDGEPVDPRGIALTDSLVSDGASPLYVRASQPLDYAIRSARLALDPLEVDSGDLQAAA
jgi:hypothetical protein